MKIGFIYEGSFATNNGSNHLLASIIEKMLENGHEIYLYQPSFVSDTKEYPDSFESPSFHYCPIKMNAVSKTSFVKRYLNGISFSRKCYKEFRNLELDLFFIQSSPTVSFIIKKAKKKRKPIIFNIHDVFPGSAYELGIIKFKFLNGIFEMIQKTSYRSSDKVIVVSEDMKNILLKQKVNPDKIEVVQTWYDSDSIKFISNENNRFLKENNIDETKLIVQYAGNVGQVFGLDEFVEVVQKTKNNPNIEYHIVGSGVKLESLKIRTQGCHIRFFGWHSQDRMSEVFSYPDVEIIPLHHGVIGNDVPSKMALAMACGKPVINIVEKSCYYDSFRENRIGWAFEQNDLNNLIDLLNQLSIDKKSLEDYKSATVEYNDKNYSKSTNTAKVMAVISSFSKMEE